MSDKKSNEEEQWLTQMYVFPEDGDAAAQYEYDVPYVVEYNPVSGGRRTRTIDEDLQKEIRELNGYPAEEVK